MAALWRVMRHPTAGDIDAPRYPGFVVSLHIVEKACQGSAPARPADETAMQPDGEHLRRIQSFSIEDIERIFQIVVELIAGVEALRGRKAHIIGIERIR